MKNHKFSDIFLKNNPQKFNIQNFKEVSTSRPAPSVCKWNKIINFVLSFKLVEAIGFLQGYLKAYIFYAIVFFTIYGKRLNKNFLYYI